MANQNQMQGQNQIDLNSASEQELQQAGIHRDWASKIVQQRDRVEGFDSLDDLSEIPNFSVDTVVPQQLRSRFTFGDYQKKTA